jgi:hypothetical protein
MLYTLSHQQYKYEHGLNAAERRAADIRAGQAAAGLRDLRLRLRHAFRLGRRVQPARGADTVTASRATAPARVLSGIR